SGARILAENNLLFLGPENPSAFDPVVVAGTDTSALFSDHRHKTGLECHTKNDDQVVYSVQLSHMGNALINGQQLSKSKPSPAVGHMQIYNRATGVGYMQQQQEGVSEKRALRSTPSPGAGH
ncbi:hypothetical protein KI387_001769, partial [Taxus chinensis]